MKLTPNELDDLAAWAREEWEAEPVSLKPKRWGK
jgi:hypothetical protein